ncbi:MAG: flagellar hook-length control protein FliK, partial [Lachnospiraceae bacterium]|nr:flagellar hook-length control protein FliK [Lachnospiraceae bacterium]
ELSSSPEQNEAIRNVLESNEFKKMFSDVVKKHWALDPKEMKDPKEIDELYNKIAKQSKTFENVIGSKGGDTSGSGQNFQNMRQNMQFMEQLNQQMIYAQMPLKLSNQNANSELFVYADKRKLMEKKDGISVMLHLDMDHLGMTDIKVTLTGTNVNARFYLNDQESVDIVADNMVQLAKQLSDRGFSLTNEVVKRTPQESINRVVDEILDENAERSIKRYTFDART